MSGLGKTSDDGPAPVQPAPDRAERMIDDDRIRVYVEVTNTLITGGTTGMQRLCRRLLTSCWALDAADTAQVEIIAMRWCGGCQEHVLLTDSERELLFRPKPLPPSRLERIPKLLRRPTQTLVRSSLGQTLIGLARRMKPAPTPEGHDPESHGASLPPGFEAGAWFVDVEAAWWNEPNRSVWLQAIHRAGGRTGVIVADLFPTTNPEWFDKGNLERFSPWVDAHLRNDSMILAISEFSRRQALDRRRSLMAQGTVGAENWPELMASGVVRLGADFGGDTRAGSPPSDVSTVGFGAPVTQFLLCVSTVEPRKNHELILDVFDRLSESSPTLGLVLVGRSGWRCESIVSRITGHREFGRRILWLQNESDARLDHLYRQALLTLAPSHAEGLGLSIMESLGRGTPVVAADAGAQREAGGDDAEYPSPNDAETWAKVVRRHLDLNGNPSDHHRQRRAGIAAYAAPSWEEAARQFIGFVTLADDRARSSGQRDGTTRIDGV